MKDESCIVVDMINEYMKKCREGQHEWGYNVVEHDEINHPTGEQVCMHCQKPYSVFLKEYAGIHYDKGYKDGQEFGERTQRQSDYMQMVNDD